ncbi:MAG: S1 RNA-binding domain-containing protein [Chloroflexota bacterium]
MFDEMTLANDEATPAVAAPKSLADLRPKMELSGKVSRLELYGAFIDIGLDTPALIHISQLGKEHVNRVSDVLKTGDQITVWVDKLDPQRNQVTVTMIKPLAVEWNDLQEGQVYTGLVTRLENFGAFVDIGAPKEGLVHVSEVSNEYLKHPSEQLKVGDEVQVKVLAFNKRKRRIDLSMKALLKAPEPAEPQFVEESEFDDDEEDEAPTSMEIALRAAMGPGVGRDDRRRRSRGRGRHQHSRGREQQEDILSRTLRMQR